MENACESIMPDYVIHLGDFVRDGQHIRELYSGFGCLVIAGNSDGFTTFPNEKAITLDGILFFCTHGHRQGVKAGLSGLASAAKARGCGYALYGHTHLKRTDKVDGVICINPGSVGFSGSYTVIETNNGNVTIT